MNITEFSHEDDAGIITYTLTTAAGWSNDDLAEIIWTLDFTPDGAEENEDACIKITPADPDPELTVELFDPCSETTATTPFDGEAVHAADSVELELTYSSSALDTANGGTEVEAYSYFIEATDSTPAPDEVTDRAPDAEGVTHTLSAQAEPTPTPTPDPDSDPTPEPTDEPTDEPTPTAPVESADEPQLPATGSGAMRTAATAFVLLGWGSVLISHARRKTRGG